MGNRGATRWDFLHGGSTSYALQRFMASSLACFWCFFSGSLIFLLVLLRTYFLRYRLEKSSREKQLKEELLHGKYDDKGGAEEMELERTEYGRLEDEEKDGSSFSFKFPVMSAEEIRKAVEELGEEESAGRSTTATTVQKYYFQGAKAFIGFVEEPEAVNLSVAYACLDQPRYSIDEEEEWTEKELLCENNVHEGFVSTTDFDNTSSRKDKIGGLETENLGEFTFTQEEEQERHEDSANDSSSSEDFGASKKGSNNDCELETENSIEIPVSVGQVTKLQVGNPSGQIEKPIKAKFLYQKDFFPSICAEVESEDDIFVHGFKEAESSSSDTSMSDRDETEATLLHNFDKSFEYDSSCGTDNINNSALFEEPESDTDPMMPHPKEELVESIEEMEDTHVPNSSNSGPELSESEGTHLKNSSDSEEFVEGIEEMEDDHESNEDELRKLENELDSEWSDESNLESLWEHQDLIEQLKMEIKKVRSIGLPTILEESPESPKVMEESIPWKFEEKFLQEDPMDELQKFYKSYRERMRKFDILSYQKMYALGFLNLKDHLPGSSTRKSTLPSFLPHNLSFCRPRKSEPHPLRQLAVELHNDMETVYVGQACLSWEFLQWQYDKAREMSESDPHGRKPFNQFAGELQQFQVVLQRFLENEPFQGPRVQNYVKSRCMLRNLLQVPSLREDCYEDKAAQRMRRLRGEEEGITSLMAVTMMEESMRIFWQFIHADKEEVEVLISSPSDAKLLSEVRSELHKKERKLKDLMRAGQCLVKRLQKHSQEEARHHQTAFLALVDMRLVSRVLRMSNTTGDQLMWCQKKLNRITFRGRKIHRESSFLLFPC